MKIVLREHVEHLGERGETVTVSAGYARNYLLPKGLALEATPGNLKTLAHQHRVWAVRDSREVNEAKAIAARLSELELIVSKKAGESGTLYGSVTNSEIAEMLSGKGVEVDRRRIVLEEPIKTVGTHEVGVKLHRQVTGQVKIVVSVEQSAE